MKIAILFCSFVLIASATVKSVNIIPAKLSQALGITLLDQKQLIFNNIKGVKFTELSDVTYDSTKSLLYFVGDRGSLFTFRAQFSDKIDQLIPVSATRLQNKKGKKFRKWKRDSEGLTLDGRGRLLISFEGKAKIAWFHKNSKKVGRLIHKYRLPKLLRETKNYRSKNKSLESLAWHKKYGILTATEWPLKKDDKKKQTIYALSGKQWHFKAEPESRSAVVAMEVMDDGNILVVERSYISLLKPFVVTLKKVYLSQSKNGWCKTKVLAKMNTHKGWDIDNFEGLAKVGKNRYLIVSDDNDNFFQRTLLLYFKIN